MELLAAECDQEKKLKAEGVFAVKHGHISRLQAQLQDVHERIFHEEFQDVESGFWTTS